MLYQRTHVACMSNTAHRIGSINPINATRETQCMSSVALIQTPELRTAISLGQKCDDADNMKIQIQTKTNNIGNMNNFRS